MSCMEVRNPHIVVLAGPNGAGKSTVAPFLLRGTLQVREFVNADVIARGISGFEPHGAAIQAGRVMLSRLKRLAESRVDFAFETTLAGRGFARWIAGLVSTGYAFSLVFLWLPSPSRRAGDFTTTGASKGRAFLPGAEARSPRGSWILVYGPRSR